MTKTIQELTVDELTALRDLRIKAAIIHFIEPNASGKSPLEAKIDDMMHEALSEAVVQHLGLAKNPWKKDGQQSYTSNSSFNFKTVGPLVKFVEAETKKILEGLAPPELNDEDRTAITKSVRAIYVSTVTYAARQQAEAAARKQAEALIESTK